MRETNISYSSLAILFFFQNKLCGVVAPLESPGTSLQGRDVWHRNETKVVWKATSFHLTVCFALVANDSEGCVWFCWLHLFASF